jgi:hypothetical protein
MWRHAKKRPKDGQCKSRKAGTSDGKNVAIASPSAFLPSGFFTFQSPAFRFAWILLSYQAWIK